MVNKILANDNARFDGFPKSNFISQQISLDRIVKHAASDIELMRLQFDRR